MSGGVKAIAWGQLDDSAALDELPDLFAMSSKASAEPGAPGLPTDTVLQTLSTYSLRRSSILHTALLARRMRDRTASQMGAWGRAGRMLGAEGGCNSPHGDGSTGRRGVQSQEAHRSEPATGWREPVV